MIDFSWPVGVLLFAMLHFVPDDDNPTGLVARLTAPLTAGSYLAISYAWAEDANGFSAISTREVYSQSNAGLFLRSPTKTTRFFASFEIVDPGSDWITRWRPATPSHEASFTASLLGGAGYKRTAGTTRGTTGPSA